MKEVSLAESNRAAPAAGDARAQRRTNQRDLPMQQVEHDDPRQGRARDGEADEDALGAGRASYGDDLDTLDRRRTEELKLIGQYDS